MNDINFIKKCCEYAEGFDFVQVGHGGGAHNAVRLIVHKAIHAVPAKDIEDASPTIYFPSCREHILGARRRKYIAYGNAIEQTRTNITEKNRYMA